MANIDIIYVLYTLALLLLGAFLWGYTKGLKRAIKDIEKIWKRKNDTEELKKALRYRNYE